MNEAATVIACVGLGSNLGDRRSALAAAVEGLKRLARTEVVAVSRAVETRPVAPPEALAAGLDPGGPYLNAAAVLRTALPPWELLEGLLAIEREMGRDRRGGTGAARWGARVVDLDLLLYGDAVIDEAGLVVPHPRMGERAFVLVPLAEVAAEVRVPPRGSLVRELLAALESAGGVEGAVWEVEGKEGCA